LTTNFRGGPYEIDRTLHLSLNSPNTLLDIVKNRQCSYVYHNIQALSHNHCCSWKTMIVAYSRCVCVCLSLVIQHAKCTHHVILPSVSCSGCAKSFPRYLKPARFFFWGGGRKCYWTWNVFWFSLQLLSENVLILGRIKPIIINGHRSSCNVPVMLYCNETWIFSAFSKETSNMKCLRNSVQWKRSCSMRTDGTVEKEPDRQTCRI
jgi:hypothetical protein